MAVVLENKKIINDIYLITLKGLTGKSGQFYMLKPNPGASDPLLGRPISIFDARDGNISFLYRVVGRGTQILSSKRQGSEVEALGPLGNGFTHLDEDAVLIGGGIGIAPLYLLARERQLKFPNRSTKVFLGFSDDPYMVKEFGTSAEKVWVNIGGYITDDVSFEPGMVYYACGPEPMLKAAANKAHAAKSRLYVSLERRMACGVGACLGCTIKTKAGNKRVCKDGPVFDSQEVYYE